MSKTDEMLGEIWTELAFVQRCLAPANPGFPPVPQQSIDEARLKVIAIRNRIHTHLRTKGQP